MVGRMSAFDRLAALSEVEGLRRIKSWGMQGAGRQSGKGGTPVPP